MRAWHKLTFRVALGISLSLALAGCGSTAASNAQTEQEVLPSQKSERKADAISDDTPQKSEGDNSDENSAEEDTEARQKAREADSIGAGEASSNDSSSKAVEPEAETITIGETKVTDDYELTILSAEWADEVYPDTSQTAGSYMYFADEEGKSYFLVKFSFRNLMSHFYDFQDHPVTTEQQFVFNDSYQFAAAVYDPEQAGLFTSGICYSVEPLDTRTYYIVASISDDIRNNMQSGQLSFNLKRITATDAEHYTVDDDYMGKYLVDVMQ